MRTCSKPVTKRNFDGVKHRQVFGGCELIQNAGIGRGEGRCTAAEIAVITSTAGVGHRRRRIGWRGVRCTAVTDYRKCVSRRSAGERSYTPKNRVQGNRVDRRPPRHSPKQGPHITPRHSTLCEHDKACSPICRRHCVTLLPLKARGRSG